MNAIYRPHGDDQQQLVHRARAVGRAGTVERHVEIERHEALRENAPERRCDRAHVDVTANTIEVRRHSL